MQGRTGRTVSLTVAGLGIAVLAVAVVTLLLHRLREDRLIRQLESESWDEIGSAAKALGEMRSMRAIPALVKAFGRWGWLESEMPPIATALIRIGAPSVRPLLEESDKGGWVVTAIGSSAVPELCVCLEHPSPEVRSRAAGILGAFGRGAESAVPALARRLSDPDFGVRLQALSALFSIGIGPESDVVPALLSLAGTTGMDIPNRVLATELLSSAGRAAVPALASLLADEEPLVRKSAAFGLGTLGGEESVSALLDILHAEDPDVRATAIFTLAQIGTGARRAVPAVVDTLGDPEGEVRRAAAIALASIGWDAPEVPPALRGALQDPDPDVSAEAARALEKIGAGR